MFDEDSELRTTLNATGCTSPAWSLEGTTNPHYQPVLDGAVLVHRFAPDKNGLGAVTLRVRCVEGDAAAAVTAQARPQPDVMVSFHEVTGADHLITAPIRLGVNGMETTLGPEGGRVQLLQGSNLLHLVTNAGWRTLQVWELEGLVVPLSETAPGLQVTVATSDDDRTAKVRLLHPTAHAWYRAGTASEADVRAQYWSDENNGILRGFVGFRARSTAGGLPIFTQVERLEVGGLEVCTPGPGSLYFDYQDAIAAQLAPIASLGVSLGWQFAESLPDLSPYSSLVNGEVHMVNGWSLACDAPVAAVDEYYHPSPTGHVEQLVIRIPSGSSQAERIAALWRLPRKMGVKVPGSAWVSATTDPGPADLKVAEHFFPLADAAAQLGMPPIRF